ncbi:MAG TPA: hypothetical protein VNE62_08455 [Actinomycetota bacterium]|nr:hypothetical protein [Actinomycetota bacterium]
MSWQQVSVVVPSDLVERLSVLAEASGVTMDGFVAASMEIRCREHEGRTELSDGLAEAARRFDAERPK